MTEAPVIISVTNWDSGCLPEVLRNAIARAQQGLRNCDHFIDAAGRKNFEDYIQQIRNCLAAVEAGRAAWVRGEPAKMAEQLREVADRLDDVDCPKCGATVADGFQCKPGDECPVR